MKALIQKIFIRTTVFAALLTLTVAANASVTINADDTNSSLIASSSDWVFDNVSSNTELAFSQQLNAIDAAASTAATSLFSVTDSVPSSFILILAGILSLGIARRKINS